MRDLFTKKRLLLLSLFALGLLAIAWFLITANQDEPADVRLAKQRLAAQQYAAQIIPLLTHDQPVVGAWGGVRSSGELGYSRSFSKSGQMRVCYGDVVIDGSYQIV